MYKNLFYLLLFLTVSFSLNAQTRSDQRQKKTSSIPVLKFNAGTWKKPNEIAVTKGLAIKEALEKRYGQKLVVDTTMDNTFDILYCPDNNDHGMCFYFFFSKGFKRFYAATSFATMDKRNYDDAIFKNKYNKSFKQEDTYKARYREKNEYGFIHHVLNRDEYLYERYLTGGSKYYCTEITIADYTSDCNTISKPKTKCAIIQAIVNLLYLKAAHARQRQGLSY